jgi:hypothetical protein
MHSFYHIRIYPTGNYFTIYNEPPGPREEEITPVGAHSTVFQEIDHEVFFAGTPGIFDTLPTPLCKGPGHHVERSVVKKL